VRVEWNAAKIFAPRLPVINPETIKLPVWVVAVGLVHAAALALVLPMLITLPTPTGDDRNVEAVGVELVPAAQPAPKMEQDVDQTAALPSSPQPAPAAEGTTLQPLDEFLEDAPEPSQEAFAEGAASRPAEEAAPEPASAGVLEPTPTPDAVANAVPESPAPVESDSAPAAGTVEHAEPEGKAPGPRPAMVKKPKAAKPKAEAKASKAKAAKPAPKKPAAAKPAQHKPFFRKTAQDLARKEPPPFKGPWSQLFGGAPPSPDKR